MYTVFESISILHSTLSPIYTHFSRGLNSIRIIIKDSRVLHSSPLGIISLRCVVWHLCQYSSVRTGSLTFIWLFSSRRAKSSGVSWSDRTCHSAEVYLRSSLLLLSPLYMFYVSAHVSTDSVGRTATLRVVRLLSLSLCLHTAQNLRIKSIKRAKPQTFRRAERVIQLWNELKTSTLKLYGIKGGSSNSNQIKQ